MQNEQLSARGFTASAIHIVEQLCPRAADRRMSAEATPETLTMLALWSLLRWEKKVALVALERMGVNPDALARAVDEALVEACSEIRQHAGPPQYRTLPSGRRAVVVDFDTPLVPLLDAAECEAEDLHHGYVGTEHLLLAIIRRACPRLRDALRKFGVTHVKAKGKIVQVLRSALPEVARRG